MYSGTVKKEDWSPRNTVPLGRPVMRYHGGKWKLSDWIIERMPAHRCYVEPYGGAASVLLRKPRSYCEVYNELDRSIWNVFRVLRDNPEELRRRCWLTPWSRVEFEKSYEDSDDPVEWARRTIIRTWMSHGTTHSRKHRTGFRSRNWANRGSTTMAEWRRWPQWVESFAERLRGVNLECREAIEVIRQQDSKDTLFYIDPPYLLETRTAVRYSGEEDRCYTHNLSREDHTSLANVLKEVSGMVMLSGYPSILYDDLYGNWKRETKIAFADGARRRTECLWFNDLAIKSQGLFKLFE